MNRTDQSINITWNHVESPDFIPKVCVRNEEGWERGSLNRTVLHGRILLADLILLNICRFYDHDTCPSDKYFDLQTMVCVRLDYRIVVCGCHTQRHTTLHPATLTSYQIFIRTRNWEKYLQAWEENYFTDNMTKRFGRGVLG